MKLARYEQWDRGMQDIEMMRSLTDVQDMRTLRLCEHVKYESDDGTARE